VVAVVEEADGDQLLFGQLALMGDVESILFVIVHCFLST